MASLSYTPVQPLPSTSIHVIGMDYPYGATVTLALTGTPAEVPYSVTATPSIDPSGQIAADMLLGATAQYTLAASIGGAVVAQTIFQV